MAVRRLAADHDARGIVYLGDDLGDVAAFAAVEELRAHGGVPGVCVASVDPTSDETPAELVARADLVLAGPDAVVAWLGALAATVGEV